MRNAACSGASAVQRFQEWDHEGQATDRRRRTAPRKHACITRAERIAARAGNRRPVPHTAHAAARIGRVAESVRRQVTRQLTPVLRAPDGRLQTDLPTGNRRVTDVRQAASGDGIDARRIGATPARSSARVHYAARGAANRRNAARSSARVHYAARGAANRRNAARSSARVHMPRVARRIGATPPDQARVSIMPRMHVQTVIPTGT
jgi:hypothetical protein